MGDNVENFGEIPVQVMAEADIDAFIHASGEVPIYLYYTLVNEGVGLKMHVALWDADRDRERWLAFDFLSAQIAAQRNARLRRIPHFPVSSSFDETIRTFGETPGSIAGDTKALYAALANRERKQRDAALVSLAQQGNFAATSFYVYSCLVRREATCESTSADLLLPWAEAHSAMAMLMLAVLQADPATGRAGEKSAKALLDAADRRVGKANASAQFAALLNVRNKGGKFDGFVRKRLQMAADEGNPNAEWLLALREVSFEKRDGKLREKTMAGLVHAANTGSSGAQDMLARQLLAAGKKDDALKWFESAAELGDIDSQRWLASAFESGTYMHVDIDKARNWHARAANNGNVDSMLWLAAHYSGQPQSAETRHQRSGWLRSATVFGNIDASVQLADLFSSGGDGLDAGPKEAETLYREVLKSHDRADARRGLASLLFGAEGVEKNVEEARKLLSVDAEKGDADSQLELGLHWLRGDFGPIDASAREWLGKAADAGNARARNELGTVLYYNRDGRGRDAQAGMARIEGAAELGLDQAMNNLAWMLCTTDTVALRDGQRGLGVAKLLNKEVAGDVPAWIDTLAACHAATGDFDQAARLEQQMVDTLTEVQADNRDIPYFTARAQQYRDGKPFIETIEAK